MGTVSVEARLDRRLIFDYLLGKLSEQDREQLERAYFADSLLLEEIDSAETDLIDMYVRDLLAADDRARFESHYLAGDSKRNSRVTFARALTSVQRKRSIGPAWESGNFLTRLTTPRVAFAALALAALITASWWFVRHRRQPEQAQTYSVPAQTEAEKPPAADQPPLVARTEPPIVEYTLQPGGTRASSELQPLRIPRNTRLVRLRLALDDRPEGSLSAAVESVEGREIFRTESVRVRSTEARIDIPSKVLTPGEFVIRLTSAGNDTSAEYLLKVR